MQGYFSEYNLKLNEEKCKFRVNKVQYDGHEITSEGLYVQIEKRSVQYHRGNNPGTSKGELKTFLYSVSWKVYAQHVRCQPATKKTDSQRFGVAVGRGTRAQLSASEDHGYNGTYTSVLTQKHHLRCQLTHASRALSDAQTRYGQIEKEMLAISYGFQKFSICTCEKWMLKPITSAS